MPSSGLSVDISEQDLKYALEGIPGMGQVSVSWQGTCRRPKWKVVWLTRPGDQPLIQVAMQFYFSVHIIPKSWLDVDPLCQFTLLRPFATAVLSIFRFAMYLLPLEIDLPCLSNIMSWMFLSLSKPHVRPLNVTLMQRRQWHKSKWFIFQINSSSVVGENLDFSAKERVKGGLLMRSVTGDLFRVLENKPQVGLWFMEP